MILSSPQGILTLMVFLTACSSPAVRYYTLVAPATETPHVPEPAAFLINVLPVGIPPQIDQSQLVVRRGESGALVLDNDRWLSPLGDEIRTALSASLTQRLGSRDISGLTGSTADRPVLMVHLEVRRFDSWPGQFVKFEADWSLKTRSSERPINLLCHSQFTEAAPGGYAAMLVPQQKVITRLAAQIAATADKWSHGDTGGCSQ